MPITYRDSLKEIQLGKWEGLTYAEVKTKYPSEWEKWENDPKAEVGLGVESNYDMQQRALGALCEIAREEKENVLIVTHGAWINRLMCHLLCVPLVNRMAITIHNTSFNILDCSFTDSVPVFKVETLNDTSHLFFQYV